MGIVHFLLMLRSARESSLIKASSLGNEPRLLVTLRRLMLTDSIALVVSPKGTERSPIFWTGKLVVIYQLARRVHEPHPPTYFHSRV